MARRHSISRRFHMRASADAILLLWFALRYIEPAYMLKPASIARDMFERARAMLRHY